MITRIWKYVCPPEANFENHVSPDEITVRQWDFSEISCPYGISDINALFQWFLYKRVYFANSVQAQLIIQMS